MSPDLMTDAGASLIKEGVLGIAVFMLIGALVYIYRQKVADRAKHDAQVANLVDVHRREIAAKDALISQQYEERIKETRIITDLVKSMESTLESFLLTVRRGSQ